MEKIHFKGQLFQFFVVLCTYASLVWNAYTFSVIIINLRQVIDIIISISFISVSGNKQKKKKIEYKNESFTNYLRLFHHVDYSEPCLILFIQNWFSSMKMSRELRLNDHKRNRKITETSFSQFCFCLSFSFNQF